MAACWSRGGRSEVPETLPPTVPVKSLRPRATPYSVTAVPSTGISVVAAAAACRAGVALARIRSTPLETKVLLMVAQVVVSFCAFWKSNSTFSSPSCSFRASSKPLVAASRASCSTSWQIPILYLVPAAEAEPASLEAAALEEAEPPQPVRAAAHRLTARIIESAFFMFVSSLIPVPSRLPPIRLGRTAALPYQHVFSSQFSPVKFNEIKYSTLAPRIQAFIA